MELRNMDYWAITEDANGTIVALGHGVGGQDFYYKVGDKLRWLHPDYHDRVCKEVRNLPKHEKYSGYQPEPVKPELPPRPKVGEIVHVTQYSRKPCAMDCQVTRISHKIPNSFYCDYISGTEPDDQPTQLGWYISPSVFGDKYTIGAKCEPPQPELPAWVKPGAIWSHKGKGNADGRTYYRLDKCEGDVFYSTEIESGRSGKTTGRSCFEVGQKGGLAAVQWQPKPDERVRLIDGACDVTGEPISAKDIVRVQRDSAAYLGAYLVITYKDGKDDLFVVKLDQLMPYVEAA